MSEVEPEGDDAGPAELSVPRTGSVEDRLVGLFEGLKLARSTSGDEARPTRRAALGLMAALLGRGAGSSDDRDQGRADPCGSEEEFDASPGRAALRDGHHDGSTITVTAAEREPSFNGCYAFDGAAQRWQHTADPGLSCSFGPARDVRPASADPDGDGDPGHRRAPWWPTWQFEARVASPSPPSPPSPSGGGSGSGPSPYFQIVGCMEPPTGTLQHWYCGAQGQGQAVPDPAMRVRYTRPAPAVDEAVAACVASLQMKALAAVITVTKRSCGPDSKTAMNMLMRLLNRLCAADEVETAYRVMHDTLSGQLRIADEGHPDVLKMAVTISLGLNDKGDLQAAAATFTETMAAMATRWGTTLTSANLAKLRQQAGQQLAPKSTASKSPRGGLRV